MSIRGGLESIARDSRFASRQMARSPAFTALALAAIALGIGANATVFSFLRALHFRAPAVHEGDRLAAVHRIDVRTAGSRSELSAADYAYYRESATAFADLAVQNYAWAWLSSGDRSTEWESGHVSVNYFDVLVSFHASRRRREIGIRMALGAQAGQVVLWTMSRGVLAALAGLAAGLAIAMQASRLIAGFLFGVGTTDPITFGAAAAVLVAVTVAAGFLPARSAAHIDPALALRDQ